MARIVIFTSGTLGDHLPYLAMAQGLQQQGHDMLMVINQAMHAYAARAGLPAVALTDVERGPEEARENAWAWDHWNNPIDRAQAHPKAQLQPASAFVTQVRELAGHVAGADLLLATSIRAQGLGAHLATGVPWLTLSVNPSAFGMPAAAGQEQQVFALQRAQYAALRPLLDHALAELGRPQLPPAWHRGVLWAPQVLLGSSPFFSTPNLDQLQPLASIDQTGFWFWQDPAWETWQPGPELTAFMARRPLVLTFSSQPLEDPRAILRRHVQAATHVGLPLVVQRGWAGFSEADLPGEADSGNVFFLDYAPHDWLFARAAATIQHGGIGSLARALRQGCSVLVEPFGNDQFYNAQRVEELGVGARAHPFETSAEALARIIEGQVLAQAARLRAKRLGRALAAEDGVARAVGLVELLLARGGKPQRSRWWWGVRPLGQPLAAQEAFEVAPSTEATIPRILHQTWKTEAIPPEFEAWVASWHTHHPDWEYRLWTDADCRELIEKAYPWFLATYDRYPQQIMRVDAARYFILHRYGGVYADLDYEALRPLDPLLEGEVLVLTEEPPAHMQQYAVHANRLNQLICNAWMASAPGQPFWEHVFDQLAAWQDAPGPLDATGPFLLSRAYAGFAGADRITLAPHTQLCPISSEETWQAQPPVTQAMIAREAYALHHWYGGWHKDPPVNSGVVRADLLIDGRWQPAAFQVTRDQLAQAGLELADPPLVSCLMVTRERTLLAQLAVHSYQNQSYPRRELIIVDDGPDDALAAWVAALDDQTIRFLRLPDEGQSLGTLRNVALEAAEGALVAQWDDDDYAAPQRLAVQVGAMTVYRVDACALLRQMVWLPGANFLGKSARRLWEGSALLPRTAVPRYPAQARGEDTPVVTQAVSRGSAVLLDAPELYLYLFHGGNTFDAAHWQAQVDSATTAFRHYRYLPALRALERFLQVDLRRLGAYLRGELAVDPSEMEGDARETAGNVTPVTAVAKVAEEDPLLLAAEEQFLAAAELPTVLILTPVKDAAAHLPRFLTNLRALSYPRGKLSLGFLESDSRDDTYAVLAAARPSLAQDFRRVTLLKRDFDFRPAGARWAVGIQRQRRATLARSRNALLQAALRDEAWVLWIDSDMATWPEDIIQQLLAARKQIVVPNCLRGTGEAPYDLNSFRLTAEAAQLDWSPYIIDGLLQPPKHFGREYLTDLRGEALVELNGVGATMLLVDADLHREGLIFPPFSYEGLIESEGLARMAREMGVGSWGLPDLIVRHE